MLEYAVTARRIDSHGSEAHTKDALIVLDTDMAGRPDAFNPAELLLASLAACILKGAERIIPILDFDLRGIDVANRGMRQDSPPKMTQIELLHRNLQKYGTIYNTLAGATKLSGSIRRVV